MNNKLYTITAALLIVVPICCGLLVVGAAIGYSTRSIESALVVIISAIDKAVRFFLLGVVNHPVEFFGAIGSVFLLFSYPYIFEMMNHEQGAVARKFAIYGELSLLDRWKFRRSLKWVGSDAVSQELLLDFEKESKEKLWASRQILEFILNALSWYNRERHDDHLQSNRLPEMLQIVLIFISRGQRLHYRYRDLVLNILHSGDKVGRDPNVIVEFTPERFRLEVAELISNLNNQGSGWDRWNPNLERGGNLYLGYLENIASKVSDPQLFTQFRFEAAKAFSNGAWPEGKLGYLEKIAGKVNDSQSFSQVFNDVVPVIGLETTSSLLAITRDFQEFRVRYHRIIVQVEQWGSDYTYLFRRAENTFELDRLLVVLETLPKNIRMTRYILYAQTHRSGTLLKHVSGALHAQKGYVLHACSAHDWKEEPDVGRFVESQIDQFEQNLVDTYLSQTWHSSIKSRKIRWEFTKFTEYIPYAMTSWDWTKDDERTRSYWNSTEAERREYDRYIGELKPRLLSLLRKMDFPEIEALFDLLPGYLGIQEFTKTVSVPVEWDKSIEYQEGYDRYAGNYTEEVQVGRPKRFIKHDFRFDRPYLQRALELLDSADKIHAAIQTQKHSRQ